MNAHAPEFVYTREQVIIMAIEALRPFARASAMHTLAAENYLTCRFNMDGFDRITLGDLRYASHVINALKTLLAETAPLASPYWQKERKQ